MVKKMFMIQVWRIQQSYAIFSLFAWSFLLTFTSYPYIAPLFSRWGVISAEDVLLGMAVLFLIVFFGILAFGFLYDRILKLWREQADVVYERNPYAKEKLMPKEILLWKKAHLRTLREVAKQDPEVWEDIEFMEKWIQKSLESDPLLRKEVQETEKWISQ